LGEQEYALLISMHHIVSDGWSMAVLFKELSAMYGAYVGGEKDPLPELPVQYADYAVWQRKWMEGEVLKEQAEYWKKNLEGAPELLELPADHARPWRQDYVGSVVELVLEEKLAAGLKELSARHGTTLYMTLLAAWAALLSRLSGQQDVVLGTPVANRGRVEIENLIGFFVNTLVMRVDVSGQPTVRELLARVKKQAVAAQRHQDIPFEQVVELVQPVRSLAHSPLFQVMFVWENTPQGQLELAGLEASSLEIPYGMAKFDLTLSLLEAGKTLVGGFQYATGLFERAAIERYRGYFCRMLEAMVCGDAQVVDGLPILSEEERREIVSKWNPTAPEYPSESCVHGLFEEQVRKTPEAVAVAYEEASLSYAELNLRANRLAHYLRKVGVSADARVGICVERSLEMVVGIVGILKAGGAYLPLDPAYPTERLQFMIEDSAPAVLLTQKHLHGLFSGISESVPVLDLTGEANAWSEEPETNPDPAAIGLSSENLAYVTYTSGSTGTPKAVMAEHRAVSSLVVTQVQLLAVESASRILQFASLSFDASTPEIWNALCRGAALYVSPQGTILVGEALKQVIKRSEITHAKFPPSVLATLPEGSDLNSLGTLMVSAEILTESLAKRWLPGRRLINLYGPTETTVHATLYDCDDQASGSPPVGRPIANKRAYILDQQGEPVPVGVAGELCIGGAGVSRGYLNRPELTAEKFVPDQFSTEPGERMYRTGDLGRFLKDGTIEFIGRNDEQVKVRGFRIELGEIEARLAEHAAVREAAAVVREESGDKRLVAYYTALEGHGADQIGAEVLRAFLARKLPEYMVPAAYVRLHSLPLTPNGKLDRKALPAPDANDYGVARYAAPEGEVETIVARIWAEVLKVERVGRQDNFFALGGHSLLVMRVTSRIRQILEVEVKISDMFAQPVLSDFARVVESARYSPLPAITRAERGSRFPLSFAQQRLWFLAQMEGVSRTYHIPLGMRLRGELNVAALKRALDRLVARHEALRTSFVVVQGEPEQRISAVDESQFDLHEQDLRGHEDASVALDQLIAGEANAKFDLENGPLIRGRLIRLGDQEYLLLICMHHIVSDGWSMRVLFKELSVLYGAYAKDEQDPLPELPVQYVDYAVWQRKWIEGEVLGEQAKYWKKNLEGAPELLELPADHERPARQDYAGAMLSVVLNQELTGKLKELSARHGTTLYMTLLAAWAALLSRLSGQNDVVVGTPVANRGRVELEKLIGFFVNTLVLRVDVSGRPTVREVLHRVKRHVIAAQQHQDIPFEQVVELVQPARNLGHSPLFHVMFAWQDAAGSGLELLGLEIEPPHSTSHGVSKFDLTLALREFAGHIEGVVEYATALFERKTVERYWGYFTRLLEGIVAAAESQAIDDIAILGEKERQQIVHEWNQTEVEIPGSGVHELFEEQVEQTPDAVAVEFGEMTLSYAELNRRANRLAHYLRCCEVGAETRVAVCLDRSLDMVVAMLGILKAGGAYVPLDPAYPLERLTYLLADSAAVALLTEEHLAARLHEAGSTLPLLPLGDAPIWSDQPDINPERTSAGIAPDRLAYIVYTSGSAGQPKGVMVTHRNVVRLVRNTNYADFNCDATIGHASNVAFDASTFEIWGALLNGCRLAVIPRFDVLDPHELARQLKALNVSILFLTTALFHECVRTSPGIFEGMNHILFGGENCDRDLITRALQEQPPRELVHVYGPTESTTFASYFPIWTVEPGKGIPIGRPIANTRAYILDGQGEPVPLGVVGELYIGGAGVGRGYLDRGDLTAERFLPDPFVKAGDGTEGARMYRTGDLCKWQSAGVIEFLGRNDFQVKIRGYRIELGEIEAQLLQHAGITDAAVVAREDIAGEKRLVAYYTCRQQSPWTREGVEQTVRSEELRAHLSAALPEFMVPAAYVKMDRLPLTPSGKLDRKALPAPEGDAYALRRYEAPLGEIETALAAIWRDLTGVDQVGRHDNFFELGGYSLLTTRLALRIYQQFGVKIGISELFEYAELSSLAAQVRNAQFAEFDSEEFAKMMRNS